MPERISGTAGPVAERRSPTIDEIAPAAAAGAGSQRRGSSPLLRLLSVVLVLGLWEWGGRIPISLSFPTCSQTLAALATMLADAGVQAIFSTEYRRTRDTVAPLSSKIGVAVTAHPARDTAGLVATLKSAHADRIVLIAGHSNTLPEIIKALGGPAVTIADSDYGDLFVLVPATGAFSRIRY